MNNLETLEVIISEISEILDTLSDGIIIPESNVIGSLKDLASFTDELNRAISNGMVPVCAMDLLTEGWFEFKAGKFEYSDSLETVIADHSRAIGEMIHDC